MNKGRVTCEVLKEIRKQIAFENQIDYKAHECTYEGECSGTCPACESEVRYLENEIVKKKYLGKAVVIAGLSVGLLGSFNSCTIKVKEPEKNDSNNTDDFLMIGGIPESDNTLNETPPDTFHPKCNSYNKNFILGSLEGFVVEVDTNVLSNDINLDTINEINIIDEIEGDIDRPVGLIESMPEFPGGNDSLLFYLKNNIKIPESTRNYPNGKVLIEFVIEKDGTIQNVKVLESIHSDLDSEAVRVIENMPKWKPGKQLGKPVRVLMQIPIRISIQ